MRKLLLLAVVGPLVAFAPPAATAAGDAVSGGEPAGVLSFQSFLASVRSTGPAQFAARLGSRVTSDASFAEMKAYVLEQYAGVDPARVRHSFADEGGAAFDCIPVEQQPALRGTSGVVPKAPDLPQSAPGGGARADRNTSPIEAPLSPDRKDQYGNAMFCAPGTIPMRRITLEDLARFETLRQFFRKSPVGTDAAPDGGVLSPAVAATHRYAHAYQLVANLGGHSFLNLWDPHIGANQVFSLSQHWYVGGSGGGLQTAEVGWQVFPQLYHTTKPVLFVYWTADGYQNTGCYNLTCGAFVQTNGAWTLGGAISPWSRLNGTQYELEAAYYLNGGRWWLYLKGTKAANAIGYYPASLYGGGALASAAAEIDYGGETVGTTSWPPMGSGRFAKAGYKKAAYQRDIHYYPPGGGAIVASLTGSQSWPWDYTEKVTSFAAPWNETLFFGGPGGTR